MEGRSHHHERKIRSIPPRTSLDVLRGLQIQIGGGSFSGGTRRASPGPTAEETDWSKTVAQQVFQRPPRRNNVRSEPIHGRYGKIEWETEVNQDYDGKGNLGIILQFAGIGLPNAPFQKGRPNYYGQDVTLFYSLVTHSDRQVWLLLSTCGDIFEAQVVPRKRNVDFLFQGEIYLPELATTHDPRSMTVVGNKGLVTVGYNPRIY